MRAPSKPNYNALGIKQMRYLLNRPAADSAAITLELVGVFPEEPSRPAPPLPAAAAAAATGDCCDGAEPAPKLAPPVAAGMVGSRSEEYIE